MLSSCGRSKDEVIRRKQGVSKRPEYVRAVKADSLIRDGLLFSPVIMSESPNLSASPDSVFFFLFHHLFLNSSLLTSHIPQEKTKDKQLAKWKREEGMKSQTRDCGVLCVLPVRTNSEWHMGSFLPPPHLWGRGLKRSMCEEGWISEAMQHLQCSVGLLMRAMLRMMELRGLTNFGKREQEDESGGGIWGLLLQPVWSGNLKKKKNGPEMSWKWENYCLGPSLFFFFFIKLE